MGVARARTLSRATLATALPLSRSLPFSIRLPWRMRVFLHRSRSCHPRGVIVDLVAMRNVAPRRRLSDGAGARASSSCSPLVGATLLLVMGRPCRSNAARVCVHSALAGALMFGGRRSPRVARRRRAWLSGSGGVACIRVCTLGRRLPSSVVGRCVVVRVVARACECLSLVGARVFVSVGLVAPRSALPRLLRGPWASYECASLCGPLVACRPPGDFKTATNPHHIPLGPIPV